MEKEIKRIGRKARRFSARNKTRAPARFTAFDAKNTGCFLRTDFGNPPELTPSGTTKTFHEENKMTRTFKQRLMASTAVVGASVGSAMAAVPADVTTALADAKADATNVAGLFLVVIIAIAAFHLMRRAAS